MLNLHGLPPLLPPSSVFTRCIRSRESNASQTCALDSHIMLFDSAKFVEPDHHHHLLFFARCIGIKCFSQRCASNSHMLFVSAKFVCLIILVVGCEFLLIALASKILNMSSITKVSACWKLFIQSAS